MVTRWAQAVTLAALGIICRIEKLTIRITKKWISSGNIYLLIVMLVSLFCVPLGFGIASAAATLYFLSQPLVPLRTVQEHAVSTPIPQV